MQGRVISLVGVIGASLLLAQCSQPSPESASAADPSTFSQVQRQKGGQDEFGPFEPVLNWPNPLPGSFEEGYTWGSTPGITAETPNKVWVIQRGENPTSGKLKPGEPSWMIGLRASGQWDKARKKNFVFTVDSNGKLLQMYPEIEKWINDGPQVHPHKLAISPYDPEKHIWIVDDEAHTVSKWTNDGKKLLLMLGERGKSGDDEGHFNRCTDISFAPDGSFFVSDGYLNTRVMKFDKDGKFLLSFGQKGVNPPYQDDPELETRPGYMNSVHSVAVGPNGLVYVADRENGRVQVFDQMGKYVNEWKTRMPYYILATQDAIWVSDGWYQKIAKFDFDGYFQYSWGTSGLHAAYPGGLFGVHGMSVDTDGNLYVAEVSNGRAQKFRPRPGADPTHLVGLPIGATASGN